MDVKTYYDDLLKNKRISFNTDKVDYENLLETCRKNNIKYRYIEFVGCNSSDIVLSSEYNYKIVIDDGIFTGNLFTVWIESENKNIFKLIRNAVTIINEKIKDTIVNNNMRIAEEIEGEFKCKVRLSSLFEGTLESHILIGILYRTLNSILV